MDYQFKLEALRRYRVFQEDERQKDLAEALRQRDQQAQILARLVDLRDRTEKDLKARQKDGVTGPQLTMYSNYLNKLGSDIFSQNHKVAQAEKNLGDKREALLEAMQKRKTLDKLKEKGLKAYLDRLSREEEKFINEMAISRFNHKQK
jgi:flagellar FliJ protein